MLEFGLLIGGILAFAIVLGVIIDARRRRIDDTAQQLDEADVPDYSRSASVAEANVTGRVAGAPPFRGPPRG